MARKITAAVLFALLILTGIPALQPAYAQNEMQYVNPACATTGEAKEAVNVDVQRLDEACAWVFRSFPDFRDGVTCPENFVCTLHEEGDHIVVQVGHGQTVSAAAGTFRMIEHNGEQMYPDGDAVYDVCALWAKEAQFGQSEDPSFPVMYRQTESSDPACEDALQANPLNGGNDEGATSTPAASDDEAGEGAMTPQDAADQVGGDAANWSVLPDTDGQGLKYKGPAVELTVPDGFVLDHPGGRAQAGETVTAGEATLWPTGGEDPLP